MTFEIAVHSRGFGLSAAIWEEAELAIKSLASARPSWVGLVNRDLL
jgi:hypothetical protein